MFNRLYSSYRRKYSLTIRLLVLLLLVHTIATACSPENAADEEDQPRVRRTVDSPPDTASVGRRLSAATVSLLGNPFVATRQHSNDLMSYFDRIDADFTLDADAIENRHNPSVTDTIYTIRSGKSMLELYAPTQTGDLLLQTADIYTSDIQLRDQLRVGMSQTELLNRLKTQGTDIKITQSTDEIIASNREGAPTTLHFYLHKGKVNRIKYDGYVD